MRHNSDGGYRFPLGPLFSGQPGGKIDGREKEACLKCHTKLTFFLTFLTLCYIARLLRQLQQSSKSHSESKSALCFW